MSACLLKFETAEMCWTNGARAMCAKVQGWGLLRRLRAEGPRLIGLLLKEPYVPGAGSSSVYLPYCLVISGSSLSAVLVEWPLAPC